MPAMHSLLQGPLGTSADKVLPMLCLALCSTCVSARMCTPNTPLADRRWRCKGRPAQTSVLYLEPPKHNMCCC